MNAANFNTWQAVRDEVRRRINAREWKPGEIIPGETELASEFGCARATVNRALRALAEAGLLDRRRKAGTRVALHPVRKATLSIPILRDEIEGKGFGYRYALLSRALEIPPADIRGRMQTGENERLLYLVALHLADGRAYVYENRWISLAAVPQAEAVDFAKQSPNEWLVVNIPFEGGDFAFSAISAGEKDAGILGCRQGEGLFVLDRTTWSKTHTITSVRLTFAPGYRMHTSI